MFTRQLIEEIRQKLYILGKKDSLFLEVNDVTDDTFITLVVDGVNKKMRISRFLDICAELNGNNFVWTVSPMYTSSLGERLFTISARCLGSYATFDSIEFYINDEDVPVLSILDVSSINENILLMVDGDVSVHCKATISGTLYEDTKIIKYSPSLYIGSGSSIDDILNNEHLCTLDDNLRGNFDISITNGLNLLVAIESSARDIFHRADMNGIEILFNESTVSRNGTTYSLFTSRETFVGDTYNIDING